jgi:hypothetical protein
MIKLKKLITMTFSEKGVWIRLLNLVKNKGEIEKIKVWMSIWDKIKNIQDQRLKWKPRWNHRMFLKLDDGKIELIFKIKIQLRI